MRTRIDHEGLIFFGVVCVERNRRHLRHNQFPSRDSQRGQRLRHALDRRERQQSTNAVARQSSLVYRCDRQLERTQTKCFCLPAFAATRRDRAT